MGKEKSHDEPSVTINMAQVRARKRKIVDGEVRILRPDSKPVVKKFPSGTDLRARIFGGDNVGEAAI